MSGSPGSQTPEYFPLFHDPGVPSNSGVGSSPTLGASRLNTRLRVNPQSHQPKSLCVCFCYAGRVSILRGAQLTVGLSWPCDTWLPQDNGQDLGRCSKLSLGHRGRGQRMLKGRQDIQKPSGPLGCTDKKIQVQVDCSVISSRINELHHWNQTCACFAMMLSTHPRMLLPESLGGKKLTVGLKNLPCVQDHK